MGKLAVTSVLYSTLAAFLGAVSPLSAQTAREPVASGRTIDARLLNAHNRERERLNISLLSWSPGLARQAQIWADSLAQRNVLEHSSDQARVGENLWMGTAGSYSQEEMIGGFISEARDFRPGRFPDVSRTGNWADVGHYSQVIWPDTREVGCASTRNGGFDVLVCRYWPAGNVMGQYMP